MAIAGQIKQLKCYLDKAEHAAFVKLCKRSGGGSRRRIMPPSESMFLRMLVLAAIEAGEVPSVVEATTAIKLTLLDRGALEG